MSAGMPVDWPGLLAWSVKYHDSSDTSADIKALSPEDFAFLNDALDSVIMDQTQRLRTLIEVLRLPEDGGELWTLVNRHKNALRAIDDKHNLRTALEVREAKAARAAEAEAESVEASSEAADAPSIPAATPEQLAELEDRVRREKEEALEEADEICWKVDRANGFIALKGAGPLEQALRSRHVQVRQLAASLVATLTQNNPHAQSALCATNIMPALVGLLSFEDDADARNAMAFKWSSGLFSVDLSPVLAPRTVAGYKAVRLALYALSSLLGNHAQAQTDFLANSGLAPVLRLLSSPVHAAERADKAVAEAADAVRRRAMGVLATLADSEVTIAANVAENVQKFCLQRAKVEANADKAAAAAATASENPSSVEARAVVELPDVPTRSEHPGFQGSSYDSSGSVPIAQLVADILVPTVVPGSWMAVANGGGATAVEDMRKVVKRVGAVGGKKGREWANVMAGVLLRDAPDIAEEDEAGQE